jgi:methylated-DNA-protein-cysteine methyltransferase-like protein
MPRSAGPAVPRRPHPGDLRRPAGRGPGMSAGVPALAGGRRGAASAGRRRAGGRPVFFARVYALVRRIPRGRVATYGAIASALGAPRGARTVGWALSACPDGVPWHRVVNAQGEISRRPTGGYALQRTLLRRDGVRFSRAGRIDFAKFGWKAL